MKKIMKTMATLLTSFSMFIMFLVAPETTGYASTEEINAVLDFGDKTWSTYYAGLNRNMTGSTATPKGLKEGTELVYISSEKNKNGVEVAYCYVPSEDVYCYISNRYIKKLEDKQADDGYVNGNTVYNAVLDFGGKAWSVYYAGLNKNFTGGTSTPGGLTEGTKLVYISSEKNKNGVEVAYCYVPSEDVYCYISNRYIKKLEDKPVGNGYMYNATAYDVVEGFDEKYAFDQRDYDRFLNSDGNNVGCTATALATAYSIYNKTLLSPDSDSITWNDGIGVTWGPHTKLTGYYSNNLTAVYDYVKNDVPVIIRLRKSSTRGHSVIVVGVTENADRANLSMKNFLVIDPWGGNIKTLSQACSGYTLDFSWRLIVPVKK